MVANNERIEPSLTFESIEEVLAVTRRVAEEDFRRHVQAVILAKDELSRTAAIDRMAESMKAAEQIDNALKSAITANADYRASTVEAIKGNEIGAAAGFKRSGLNMEKGAESLNQFANYVPQSKFFAAAISTVQRIDQFVATTEASAQEKVGSFARGLKAFAKGMSDFGKQVAATPSRIKEALKEKAASVSDAAVIAGAVAEMTVRQQLRRVVAAVDNAVEAVKDGVTSRVTAAKQFDTRVRESAWDRIDRFAKAAVELKNDVTSTVVGFKNDVTSTVVGVKNDITDAVTTKVNAVERHSKATIGVATDLAGVLGAAVRKLGAEVTARYEAHASAVAAEQALRRDESVPTKSTVLALAAYSGERAPIARALEKSNVIVLGVKSSAPVVNTADIDPGSSEARLMQVLGQGDAQALRAMLTEGLNPNMSFALPQMQGQPMQLSLLEMSRNEASVRLLLEAGANPNRSLVAGAPDALSNMMFRMEPAERVGAVSAMLDHGANPNGNGGRWLSPLASAMVQGDVQMTKALLDAGAKVSEPDIAAFAFHTESKLETAYSAEDTQRELGAAKGVMKALFEADRSGVESVMSDTRIVALMKAKPAVAAAIEAADRSAPQASQQQPRLSA